MFSVVGYCGKLVGVHRGEEEEAGRGGGNL